MDALIERVKNIIVKPKETWATVKEEPTTIKELFTGYIMILAAIPAAAGFLGRWIFGISVPFMGRYHVPFFRGLAWAIIYYILTLVGVYVAAKVIEMLAPKFQAQKNSLNAFKVVAYSLTPAWVIGIVTIIPDLSPLTILGLYGIYLMYVGLPYLMDCPPEKSLGYTVTAILILIVVYIVIGAISASFIGIPRETLRQFSFFL